MFPYLHIGNLYIPSYFLLISVGAVLGLRWFFARSPGRSEHIAINLATIGLVSGFVGARLLHAFFEQPMLYWAKPLQILEIWQGGFVYYGGLLAGLLVAGIYAWRQRLNVPMWLDRACLPIGLAYVFGRIGCFLNGCCYGRICFLPWAVRFPVHAAWGMAVQPRHPTQLYAVGLEALSLLLLYFLEKRKWIGRPGNLFQLWIFLHSIGRLVMEHWRDDDRGSLIASLSISTWISLLLILAAGAAVFRKSELAV